MPFCGSKRWVEHVHTVILWIEFSIFVVHQQTMRVWVSVLLGWVLELTWVWRSLAFSSRPSQREGRPIGMAGRCYAYSKASNYYLLLNYWNLFHTGHTSDFFPFQDPGEWFDSGGGWNKPGWCNSKFCCLCPEKHIWHSSVRPSGFRPVWYKSNLLADI